MCLATVCLFLVVLVLRRGDVADSVSIEAPAAWIKENLAKLPALKEDDRDFWQVPSHLCHASDLNLSRFLSLEAEFFQKGGLAQLPADRGRVQGHGYLYQSSPLSHVSYDSLFFTGPGEQGAAVSLSPQDEKIKDALYKVNGFNALVSDRMNLNRTLKDIRHPE